jgi:hypothetical protein
VYAAQGVWERAKYFLVKVGIEEVFDYLFCVDRLDLALVSAFRRMEANGFHAEAGRRGGCEGEGDWGGLQ